ncbi:hypothetical protein ACGFNY_05060 [Streptomyces chartreusis]|uniref:hypothetical protein n=1 Tax=Streptomyces chartreusis TaxID=1969 RepID=UPI00371D99DB
MSKHDAASSWHTLRISGPGHTSQVELSGHDISHALTGVTLRLDAGSVPTATLEVALWEVPTELDAVQVKVPDETRELLVRLGWTPPAEEDQS